MSEKKPFAKLRNLVVASTIALGAIMATTGCSNTGGPPSPGCPDCANWDYAHGGTRTCGPYSCGGRD